VLRTDFFAGWTRHPMADGFIFVPAEGLAAGPIRVREKLPLRRLRDHVEEAIRESGVEVARLSTIGPLVRFTTYEGEHAGMVTIETALAGGERLERSIALVAGDDFCAIIDGATARASAFATYRDVVRQLAESHYLGLGELRRRPYEYAPPAGWQGIARPYATQWYAPGFPRVAAFISVHDARPLGWTPAEVEDRTLTLENRNVLLRAPEPIAFGGLAGSVWRGAGVQDGRRIHVVRARLEDARFMYLAQLNADEQAHEEAAGAFGELLASIAPIPGRGGPPAPHLLHWLD
jgi:hypothetical protein